MLCTISVYVSTSVCREEPHFKRLRLPVMLRHIRVTDRVEPDAAINIHIDKPHRLTIQLYRNIIGVTAVVINQQVDRVPCGNISVHFITHETKQTLMASG